MNKYVILHNIRSAHNAGSIFRTADGAGVRKVFLSGCTPAPIDRFGRKQPEIEKTSLGATEMVPWEQVENISLLIEKLRKEEVAIVSVEQTKGAIAVQDAVYERGTAFVFGNEVDGIPKEVIAASDRVVHIPMHGAKESLNVAVAAGIILFNTR